MNKEIVKIIVKVLIYLLTLIGAYLGINAMTSCTVGRQSQTSGRGVGVLNFTDTIRVEHGNFVKFNFD